MQKNKVAIIEAPIQCLILKSISENINDFNIYLVKRKKWPVPVKLMSEYFDNTLSVINGVSAIFIVLIKRINCDTIYIGSHLGILNKIMIVFSLLINYKVVLMDDGLYSVHYPNWVLTTKNIFKKLNWISFYQRDCNESDIRNYCLTSLSSSYKYSKCAFLVLSNFSMLGVSREREKRLIEKAIKISNEKSMKLIVFPHRRGRSNLYRDMNLNMSTIEYLCFEQWYTESSFNNCMIIAYSSSIWGVLEDNRMENILIDLGFYTPHWIEKRVKISERIKII